MTDKKLKMSFEMDIGLPRKALVLSTSVVMDENTTPIHILKELDESLTSLFEKTFDKLVSDGEDCKSADEFNILIQSFMKAMQAGLQLTSSPVIALFVDLLERLIMFQMSLDTKVLSLIITVDSGEQIVIPLDFKLLRKECMERFQDTVKVQDIVTHEVNPTYGADILSDTNNRFRTKVRS